MASFGGTLRRWLIHWVNPPRYQSPFFVIESVHLFRAYYVAAELGIADLLVDQPKSIDALATATGSDARALFRMLRTLAGFGIFKQDRQGRFALTRRARQLRSDVPGSLRAWLIFMGRSELWQGFARTLDGVKSGRPPFELAHGAGFYEYLGAHPELAEVFARALENWSAWHASEIVKAYDFGKFEMIVDVGGGMGRLLERIVLTYPRVQGILFDQPDMIRFATPKFAAANLRRALPAGGGEFQRRHPGRRRCLCLEACTLRLGRSGRTAIAQELSPGDASGIDLAGDRGAHRSAQRQGADRQDAGFGNGRAASRRASYRGGDRGIAQASRLSVAAGSRHGR